MGPLGKNQELRHNFLCNYVRIVQHVSVGICIYELMLIYTLGVVS